MVVTADRRRMDWVLRGLGLPLVALAALDVANPQWDWVELMASYFVDGRAGWLLTVACLSLAAASAALVDAARRAGASVIGVRLLGVWVAGLVFGGLVPADPPGRWDRSSVANTVHGLAALAAFTALPVAAVVLTRQWRRDPRWTGARRMLAITVVGVVSTFLAFAVTWIDVIGGPALSVGPHQGLAGLAERAMIWAYAAWLAVVAAALRREGAGRAAADVRS